MYGTLFDCFTSLSFFLNTVKRQHDIKSIISETLYRYHHIFSTRMECIFTFSTGLIKHIELPTGDGTYRVNTAGTLDEKWATSDLVQVFELLLKLFT